MFIKSGPMGGILKDTLLSEKRLAEIKKGNRAVFKARLEQ